ncbi:hypothetical protein ILFOPFJJ_05930 [Ensifer psoraleae]|nr:SAM domain-containing protein [Sinorhizobium psoraleae]NRP75007.1 hypothetical protein [Sinorhizobium psoraleae]
MGREFRLHQRRGWVDNRRPIIFPNGQNAPCYGRRDVFGRRRDSLAPSSRICGRIQSLARRRDRGERFMDVGAWLRELGLERYERSFRENEIDARSLPHLTAEDLKELGVTLVGHRRLLLDAIAALGKTQPVDAAPEQTDIQEQQPVRSPKGEAERRQLTVLFCDLVGSTAAHAPAISVFAPPATARSIPLSTSSNGPLGSDPKTRLTPRSTSSKPCSPNPPPNSRRSCRCLLLCFRYQPGRAIRRLI